MGFSETPWLSKKQYERIASEHGYTVSATEVNNINDENQFLELIENAIDS